LKIPFIFFQTFGKWGIVSLSKRRHLMKAVRVILFSAMISLLAGCASQSGEVYQRDQAQHAQTVEMGTVEFVKKVKVEGTKSGIGTIVGGIAGGVLGNTIGSGDGSTIAAVGGALVGAGAGHMAEEKISDYDGLEITVRLDSGRVMAVVQEDDVQFFVSERVRVLTGNDGTVRIAKL
jgi:outer membrane lipoprotein SlyB